MHSSGGRERCAPGEVARDRARGAGASPRDECVFFPCSSSVVHVPGVNDIQSSSSTSQNMSQISRQLNQSQVAWAGSRPPFPGQVWVSVRALPPGAQRVQSTWAVLTLHPSSEKGRHTELAAAHPERSRAPRSTGHPKGTLRTGSPAMVPNPVSAAFSPGSLREVLGNLGEGRAPRGPRSGASLIAWDLYFPGPGVCENISAGTHAAQCGRCEDGCPLG